MRAADRPWILGIAASHNGAMCLLHGDEVVVAIQEERLVRYKRTELHAGRPSLALQYCLDTAGITIDDLTHVVLCAAGPNTLPKQAVAFHPDLRLAHRGIPFTTIPHHMGHAFGAFATSGMSEAAVLVIDGMGSPPTDFTPEERASIVGPVTAESETISMYMASGTSMTPLEKHLWQRTAPVTGGMPTFGGLGAMYSAVAYQVFGDRSNAAGKVMGLAPYGTPTMPPSDFFDVDGDRFVFLDRVPRRFQHKDRWPSRETEYQDLAASVQVALEEALLRLARRLRERTGCANLCYAGGVALNSVANERLLREAGFERVFIMPAAEDSGTAIGAAYAGLWGLTHTNTRRPLGHDTVGRAYADAEIETAIAATPAIRRVTVSTASPVPRSGRGVVPGTIRAGTARARAAQHPM